MKGIPNIITYIFTYSLKVEVALV